MVAQQVDAVWVWNYTVANQKAVYGRFTGDTTYTKDYLQVPKAAADLFRAKYPKLSPTKQLPLIFEWQPNGSMQGFLNFSSDRYHLTWSTGAPAPAPWRLAPQPTAAGPETFPGDPSATTAVAANAALAAFDASGIQGVLVAIKLVGQSNRLHLRAYVANTPPHLRFADTGQLPAVVRNLINGFRRNLACRAADFTVKGAPAVYFDPDANHNSWPPSTPRTSTPASSPASTPRGTSASGPATVQTPVSKSATSSGSSVTTSGSASEDLLAEHSDFDASEVSTLDQQIQNANYSVPNATATVKTRGSAQKAFSRAVKRNYGFSCAITGISTKEFLVASHIVPWADDESIRLDPRNGICLSTLVDQAFDSGFLTIDDQFVVHVDRAKIARDKKLEAALLPYDGKKLSLPAHGAPDPDYLRRRLTSGGASA